MISSRHLADHRIQTFAAVANLRQLPTIEEFVSATFLTHHRAPEALQRELEIPLSAGDHCGI